MRDVLWSASSFEPIIKWNNELNIDMLSEEDEREVMIQGMQAHEFYGYMFMLIIIFKRLPKMQIRQIM